MYTTNEKAMSITFFLIFSKWNEQKKNTIRFIQGNPDLKNTNTLPPLCILCTFSPEYDEPGVKWT